MGLPRRKRPVSWSPSGLETVALAPNLSFELVVNSASTLFPENGSALSLKL